MILALILLVVLGIGIGGVFWIRSENEAQTVQLFYYNADKDLDSAGNIQCSEAGLVPVERMLEPSESPLRDALELLLKGELTPEEKNTGITTEFPLEGLSLTQLDLEEGVLTLTFEDPKNKTSGGSCRVGILWKQIEATAKQFSAVKEVKFSPEWLFQP
ncbi:MAG: GerMN domain-containing protein [Candidatus Gracilibacteria bacterium]|jgi:spore germination protein GerM